MPDALPWVVVVPVKATTRGKSRLTVEGLDRVALARAIALDTIAAAASSPAVGQVIVVTDEATLPLHASDIPGLRFVPEGDARGLNAAIAAGMEAAGDRMPRAALLGDVPALRGEDLAVALRAASGVARGVVADAEGTGSTLVTAWVGVPWSSAFGEGSFAAHRALGCEVLEVPGDSTLRRDVDTADQLRDAAAFGLGVRTAAMLG
ncbi:2-phospho-L-lactate guanylyltransferase [Microbacterium sp. ET2]|uniref:2-phospho-L-lactate guanylyltransferase n=1 Tax=Microbacterium albipurpureum TaxID=3050384 RepID=UPI00259CBD04|nr:2-phospho-L-lactate guanylyltransferase [Microbacterium sp. ET2 (Ac-2212)]WJL94523.1 2-phospho-L-lactate guanylyltransferase [Microbacterium sp. ET2 (Ac-2212)]